MVTTETQLPRTKFTMPILTKTRITYESYYTKILFSTCKI